MNNTEFAVIAKNATTFKTLYVMGCFGAPMNAANKNRYTQNTAYNKKPTRTEMINAATDDTFGFDCVCLVKGLLWGWCGDKGKAYGGAVYKSNGVPDVNEAGMLALCKDVSTDFDNIEVGEYLWMQGHCGIYIGNGLAVEATPKWKNGVQITSCNSTIAGYNRRDWTKHGKLPYIEYVKDEGTVNITLTRLVKGSKGEEVKSMQILLNGKGYSVGSAGADGSFGSATDKAVREYQKAKGLTVDGICGVNTWSKLLGK